MSNNFELLTGIYILSIDSNSMSLDSFDILKYYAKSKSYSQIEISNFKQVKSQRNKEYIFDIRYQYQNKTEIKKMKLYQHFPNHTSASVIPTLTTNSQVAVMKYFSSKRFPMPELFEFEEGSDVFEGDILILQRLDGNYLKDEIYQYVDSGSIRKDLIVKLQMLIRMQIMLGSMLDIDDYDGLSLPSLDIKSQLDLLSDTIVPYLIDVYSTRSDGISDDISKESVDKNSADSSDQISDVSNEVENQIEDQDQDQIEVQDEDQDEDQTDSVNIEDVLGWLKTEIDRIDPEENILVNPDIDLAHLVVHNEGLYVDSWNRCRLEDPRRILSNFTASNLFYLDYELCRSFHIQLCEALDYNEHVVNVFTIIDGLFKLHQRSLESSTSKDMGQVSATSEELSKDNLRRFISEVTGLSSFDFASNLI